MINSRYKHFYYYSDHLGSASYITDDAADVVQQIAYMPYGEDWIDIRSNGFFGSAYKFNGKEKDPETGYNYYGARYYTDRLSIWLSVDPLSDKYPHLSPYAYCADNPVRYVDPDGMQIVGPIFTFGISQPLTFGISEPIFLGSKPIVSSASRISRLGTEIGNKLSTGGRTINYRRINVGRQTETEQLNRLGLEKNTQEFRQCFPKYDTQIHPKLM